MSSRNAYAKASTVHSALWPTPFWDLAHSPRDTFATALSPALLPHCILTCLEGVGAFCCRTGARYTRHWIFHQPSRRATEPCVDPSSARFSANSRDSLEGVRTTLSDPRGWSFHTRPRTPPEKSRCRGPAESSSSAAR